MESTIILNKILSKFKEKKTIQVKGYNSFGYLRETENTVYISREKGKDTPIPFTKLIIAIEDYQKDNDLYDLGPSALRSSGLTHVTSPIWSMLHILEKTDYQKKSV